ncbi:HNH endonuclease signature motif containing protein [Leucobacter japonicus]|uniref:HNH endonuclease signature motif containing protein n=1 Tax=Leucobacter japonicus TaxID=1461259 RepID=UPI0009E27B06
MPRLCTIDRCDRTYRSKGLCSVHYARLRKHGSPGGSELLRDRRGAACTVDGCAEPVRSRQLCSVHYSRLLQTGSTELRERQQRSCEVPSCDAPFYAKELCATHYSRKLRTGSVEATEPRRRKVCAVDGCDSPGWSGRGYCNLHYKRWKSNGDPLIRLHGGRPKAAIIDRFYTKFTPAGDQDCWNWQGTLSIYGYGVLSERHGQKNVEHKAHRISYETYRGEIPPGLMICHTCDNPACVNPNHLYAGTAQQNMDDRLSTEPTPRKNPEGSVI